MGRAKSDCDELLNAVVPFAERMLTEHGEFLPFGAAMKSSGEIVSVGSYDGRGQPPSQALIDLLVGAFREQGVIGTYKATAIAYDVLVVPPGHDRKCDAIAVALDHRDDDYSVVAFFRYELRPGGVTIQPPFANEGQHKIFLRQID